MGQAPLGGGSQSSISHDQSGISTGFTGLQGGNPRASKELLAMLLCYLCIILCQAPHMPTVDNTVVDLPCHVRPGRAPVPFPATYAAAASQQHALLLGRSSQDAWLQGDDRKQTEEYMSVLHHNHLDNVSGGYELSPLSCQQSMYHWKGCQGHPPHSSTLSCLQEACEHNACMRLITSQKVSRLVLSQMLISERFALPQSPTIPPLGWMHESV